MQVLKTLRLYQPDKVLIFPQLASHQQPTKVIEKRKLKEHQTFDCHL